jgi:hypothetical protein
MPLPPRSTPMDTFALAGGLIATGPFVHPVVALPKPEDLS